MKICRSASLPYGPHTVGQSFPVCVAAHSPKSIRPTILALANLVEGAFGAKAVGVPNREVVCIDDIGTRQGCQG